MAAAIAVLFTMIAVADPAACTAGRSPGAGVDRLHIPGLGKRWPTSIDENRPLVPLEPRGPAPAGAGSGALRRTPARPLHPRALSLRLGSSSMFAPTPRAVPRVKPTICFPRASAPGSTARCQRSSWAAGGRGPRAEQLAQRWRSETGSSPVTRRCSTGQRHRRPPRRTRRPRRRATRPELLHPIRDEGSRRSRPSTGAAAPGRRPHRHQRWTSAKPSPTKCRSSLRRHRSRVLLLTAVFRSVLVPIKAALMNLLGSAPPFGVRRRSSSGAGGRACRDRQTGPVIPSCRFPLRDRLRALHGLRGLPDSRIHEEWEHRKDATVRRHPRPGVTGRVITAAAAIMVTVFASFMLGEDRITNSSASASPRRSSSTP